MKMNFTRFLLAGFLAITMGFAACSSDEEGSLPPQDDGQGELVDSTHSAGAVDSVELWSSREGNKIYGKMYRYAGGSQQVPAVILSHSSSLTHEAMSGYALTLAKKGFAAYCFDFCGGSDKSLSDGKTDEMTVFTEVEDLRAVVATVRAQSYVDPSRIYLLGSSQGGLVSALLAEECPDDFAGMLLFYPAFNIPEMVKMFSAMGSWGNLGGLGGLGGFGSWGDWGDFGGMMSMSEAYVNSIKDFDVWSHIGNFAKPVCIIHGTKDSIVPSSKSEKAVSRCPSATLHKSEGADRGANAANLGSMGSMLGATADYDSIVVPIVEDFLSAH